MLTEKIHPHFLFFLEHKDQKLIDLYTGLRDMIVSMHPSANELLYHTHALTSLYSISEKMGDGFCMIPIYTNHLNLGFSKGTLLDDKHKLLKGTGKLIRHIPILQKKDYQNTKVKALIKEAIKLAHEDASKPSKTAGLIISKIKM